MDTTTDILIIGALIVLARVTLIRKIVIREAHAGLSYRNGKFAGVLPPGRYYRSRLATHCDMVDLRRRVVSVPGQEVLTADNVGLKLSAAVVYDVADPAKAANSVQDYAAALYAKVQLAFRAVIADLKVDELLAQRSMLGENAHKIVAWQAEELGLRVHTVEIKDVMFPGDFKRSFAEVAKARQAGQAALERARGESAVLRSLANSARLLEHNPALMNLRLLQTAAASTETTLVLGSPNGLARLKKPKRPPASEHGEQNKGTPDKEDK